MDKPLYTNRTQLSQFFVFTLWRHHHSFNHHRIIKKASTTLLNQIQKIK